MPYTNPTAVTSAATAASSLTAFAVLAFAAGRPVVYGRPGRLQLVTAASYAVGGVLWAVLGQYLLAAIFGLGCVLFTAVGVRVIRRAGRTTTTGEPTPTGNEHPDLTK